MSSVLVHVHEDADYFNADVYDREAGTWSDGVDYPAYSIAHVHVDDLRLTMTPEQAEKLHAALGAALVKHRQAAATAAA